MSRDIFAAREEGSGFRGGAGFSGRSGGDETSRGQATDEEKSATGPGPPLPLSARGLPPQERPQKKLTPLEARRARIEQQKREEVGCRGRKSDIHTPYVRTVLIEVPEKLPLCLFPFLLSRN